MLKKASALAAGLFAAAAVWAAPTVELSTTMGKITVELAADKAPESTANFLQYAKEGFYNGTIFHRVIPGFMIQGGGFDTRMNQKPTHAPIANEAKNGLKNLRGTIAMARRGDPHSATAQFFINHQDNDGLDYPSRDGWGYAVFGKVTAGMDVVDRIAQVPTGNTGMHQNVPLTPVVIASIRIQGDEQPRILQKQGDEQQRILQKASLSNFRKSLKLGDDTFCGPVVEIKPPLIKIAVRVQLQGFGSEAWLKINEVFPPEFGCKNVEGVLTPITKIY